MAEHRQQLSPKAIAVLEMIAAGNSYEQILAAYPDLTYLDIFRAAREALDATCRQEAKPAYEVADIRKTYPRAYEKWTDEEEFKLARFIDGGLTIAQIANRLQRQRSAIRSRIVKLDLVKMLSSEEQAELARIAKLDPANPDPSVDSGK
jgi:DNA-binding NarL/FixJ family response regulator